jgi:DUF4097 and DUF4098 domain-containing protein YvlB
VSAIDEEIMSIRISEALAIPALFLAASVSMAADKTFDQHFDAPAGGHLSVDSDDGSVTIVGHDARDITVHVEISGTEASAFKVAADQDSSGVAVTGRSASWLHHGFSTLTVKFTIELPHDYPVDIKTSGGGIDVRDLHAPAHGKTSGGSVALHNIAGAITMHTSGGAIEAEHIRGPAELTSSGGSINIKGAAGSLKVHTSGGGIHLYNVAGEIDASTSGGPLEAEARSNQGISLEGSGGSITLRLPADVQGTVDAKTSGGRVHSDLPITTTELGDTSHIQGTINGGGDPIHLRTSGGSIHIEALR